MKAILRISLGLAALCGVLRAEATGENLLKNGSFEDGFEDWELSRTEEYKSVKKPEVKKGKRSGNNGAPSHVRVKVPHRSAFYYLRIEQNVGLENGKIYLLSFDVRGEDPENRFVIRVSQTIGMKFLLHGLDLEVPVRKNWQPVQVLFKARNLPDVPSQEKGGGAQLRFGLGECRGEMELRNIQLREWSGPPPVKVIAKGVLLAGKNAGTASADLSKPRVWQSTQGTRLTAVLVSRQGDQVTLRDTGNNRVVQLPLSQLSPRDRKLIEANTTP